MDIQISAEELKAHAANMSSFINAMRESLETASSVMAKTEQSFDSSAGNAFRGQYNQLKSKFDVFYNEMTSYVTFLRKTAAQYEHADAEIANAARDMVK